MVILDSGIWAPWAAWGECDTECGDGLRHRQRTCTTGRLEDCIGDYTEVAPCTGRIPSCGGQFVTWAAYNFRIPPLNTRRIPSAALNHQQLWCTTTVVDFVAGLCHLPDCTLLRGFELVTLCFVDDLCWSQVITGTNKVVGVSVLSQTTVESQSVCQYLCAYQEDCYAYNYNSRKCFVVKKLLFQNPVLF